MSLNKPSGSDVAKVTSYLCVCKMNSFLAFFFGCLVHVFPARLRGYGTTPLVSRTVVPTAVVSSAKTPCQQVETLVMWHVYWAFGHALIIGERELPADLSGGLTRPQNVLCCKKQELDNSVLANTVRNFMGCSWFCERGVLAFRKADTSNCSATENA